MDLLAVDNFTAEKMKLKNMRVLSENVAWKHLVLYGLPDAEEIKTLLIDHSFVFMSLTWEDDVQQNFSEILTWRS